MERAEIQIRQAAEAQGLSVWRRGDDSWTLGAMPVLEPSTPGPMVETTEKFISGDRIELSDGRRFKREMTTVVREYLGLESV